MIILAALHKYNVHSSGENESHIFFLLEIELFILSKFIFKMINYCTYDLMQKEIRQNVMIEF